MYESSARRGRRSHPAQITGVNSDEVPRHELKLQNLRSLKTWVEPLTRTGPEAAGTAEGSTLNPALAVVASASFPATVRSQGRCL